MLEGLEGIGGERLRHTAFAPLELVQAVSERVFGVLSTGDASNRR